MSRIPSGAYTPGPCSPAPRCRRAGRLRGSPPRCLPAQHRRDRARHPPGRLPPPVRRRRARRAGSADGGHPAPATQTALTDGLPAAVPAWRQIPSWFVFGDQDLNIPAALIRFMAERVGAKGTREIAGGSHALSVSDPDVVTATILDAVAAV